MPDALLIAIVTTIGGVIGGLVVAIASPLMQDRNAKRAEDRARERERATLRRTRVERVGELLAGTNPSGDYTSTAEAGYRELRIAAAAVDDVALTEHIGRMHATARGSAQWSDAYGDARHRVGEILSRL
jgi:hypothetical protein